jgi:hypothetical protein
VTATPFIIHSPVIQEVDKAASKKGRKKHKETEIDKERNTQKWKENEKKNMRRKDANMEIGRERRKQ